MIWMQNSILLTNHVLFALGRCIPRPFRFIFRFILASGYMVMVRVCTLHQMTTFVQPSLSTSRFNRAHPHARAYCLTMSDNFPMYLGLGSYRHGTCMHSLQPSFERLVDTLIFRCSPRNLFKRVQTRTMTICTEAKINRTMARNGLRMHFPRTNNT